MTKQEVIQQLTSLKRHCESFDAVDDDIWHSDLEALDKAIKILEVTPIE